MPPLTKEADVLNQAGLFLLTMDTRWIIIAAVLIILAFLAVGYWKNRRLPSVESIGFLFLALLQSYSAAVVLGALLLTDPPAVHLLGKFERQTAGMLTAIILLGGIAYSFNSVLKKISGKENKG